MDRPLAWHASGIDLTARQPFTLGATRIDPVSRDATFPGGTERLRPQSLKVLMALERRKGEVVSRNELVELCWDGRVIGDDVINHSISQLRAFAEKAGGFSIETVPKAGYRLIEAVGQGRLPSSRVMLAATAVLAAIAIVLVLLRSDRQTNPPTPTIVILPLDHSGARTAGLAAQTRSALSHSLSEGGFPVRLANEPGKAGLILSGDVSQSGGQVRIAIRVELPSPRTIIYSQEFKASATDAVILPERIGAQVGASLSWTGALMSLDRRHPTDPAITAQLLKVSALSVQGGDRLRAYEISRSLQAKAPKAAIAQLGVAFNTALALDQIPRDQRPAAVAAARSAGEIAATAAPEFGDVHATWCLLHSRTLFAQCENRLLTALRSDPDASFVSHFLSGLYDNVGRFDEALEVARLSLANDRYKPAKIIRMLSALEATGRTDEADALYQASAQWWPDNPGLAINRMAGMAERGDFEAVRRFKNDALPAGFAAAVKAKDRTATRRLCPLETEPSISSIFCMIGLAEVGDMNGAFAFADTLYPRLHGRTPSETETFWLDRPEKPPFSVLSAPGTAAMRRDPRFLPLVDRVGLLAYWRSGRLPDFCRPPATEPICKQLARR